MKNVMVIGAAIADISGYPTSKFVSGDSNPGTISISAGGVGRNIAENLVNLNVEVEMLTAFGADYFGKFLMEDCKQKKINTSVSLVLSNYNTATYLCINNENGNLESAIAETQIINQLNPTFLVQHQNIINKYNFLALDTNLQEKSLEFLLSNFGDKKIFIDLVSVAKAIKIKNLLTKCFALKCNLSEAEVLSGIPYSSKQDLNKYRDFFIQSGVEQMFITLGKDGVYFFNNQSAYILEGIKIHPINSSGAGDAFMAGVIFGNLSNFSLIEIAKFAMACAIATLFHKNAVNPYLSIDYITKIQNTYCFTYQVT